MRRQHLRQPFRIVAIMMASVPVTFEMVGIRDDHFTRVGRQDVINAKGVSGCLDRDVRLAINLVLDELRPGFGWLGIRKCLLTFFPGSHPYP